MENSMVVPQKLKIELPYDLAVPVLGIYLKEMKALTWKNTCIPMFITALFTIAKTWNKPKCPSMDEWMKKWGCVYVCVCVCTHNGVLLNHKKWGVSAICNNVDGPWRYYAKRNKSEKDNSYRISLICRLFKSTLQNIKLKVVSRGRGWGIGSWKKMVKRYKLPVIR